MGRRFVGLAVLMVLLLGIGVTSASALPEVGRCEPQEGGPYKDANCHEKATVAADKKYGFLKNAAHPKFSNSETPSVFSVSIYGQSAGRVVTCSNESAGSGEYLSTGKIPSTKAVQKTLVGFPECATAVSAQCTTTGHTPGVIFTKGLTGKLGYISGKGTPVPEVGIELKPETAKGAVAEFTCGSEPVRLAGCLLASVDPVNVMTTEWLWSPQFTFPPASPDTFQGSTYKCDLTISIGGRTAEPASIKREDLAEHTFERVALVMLNEEPLELRA